MIDNIRYGTDIRGKISENQKNIFEKVVFSGFTYPDEYILDIVDSDPEMIDVKIPNDKYIYINLNGYFGLNPSFPYTYTIESGNYRGSISTGGNIKAIVQPGTNFDSVNILVWGQLIANGTPELPIRFTSATGNGSWRGLGFYYYDKNSSGNEISHCIIEYATTAVYVDTDIKMSNCEIMKNNYGVEVKEYNSVSKVDLHYNKFLDNKFNISNKSIQPKVVISATNNYWGHPTGPQHTTNPLGKGASVTDDVVFKPFLRMPTGSPSKINEVTGSVGVGINRTLIASDEDEISIAVDGKDALMAELRYSGDLPIALGQITPVDGRLIEDTKNVKRILITDPSPGIYKFVVAPNSATGNAQYTFRVYKVKNEVFSILPNIAPQAKLQFRVNGFFNIAEQVATLCSSTNSEIAKGVIYPTVDGLGIFQIDLSQAPVGKYNLCIDWKDEKQIIADAISIKAGLAGKLSTEIEFPKTFRIGRDVEAILHYVNIGDAPILAPAFIVSGTNALVRLNPRYEYTGTLAVMGYGQTTPINWLMPGEHRKIAFNFKQQTTSAKITLETLTISSTTAFPWAKLREQIRPQDATTEWDKSWVDLIAVAGNSWGSVSQILGNLVLTSSKPPNRTLTEEIVFWHTNAVTTFFANYKPERLENPHFPNRRTETSKLELQPLTVRLFSCNSTPDRGTGQIEYKEIYDSDTDIKFYSGNANELFDPQKYDPNSPTFVITHGNNDTQHATGETEKRYLNMADEITKKVQKNYGKTPNIIRVDWSKPAAGLYAPRKNICKNKDGKNILQSVGEDVADKLVSQLQQNGKQLNLENMVFVGHSYGNAIGYEATGKLRRNLGANAPKPTAIVLNPANKELSGLHISNYGKQFNELTSVALHTNTQYDEEDDIGLTHHNLECPGAADHYIKHPIAAHGFGIDTWAPRAIQNCWDPTKPIKNVDRFGISCGNPLYNPLIPATGDGKSYPLSGVGSFDPNDKLLWNNFVQPGDMVRFTIRFENFMTATAPAQDVLVVDQLNPMFDWTSLKFERVGFGNTIIQVNQNTVRESTSKINVRDYRSEITKMLEVNVSMKADPKSGQIVWNFTSIDPQTGQPPTDPLSGFLPPNDKTGRGDGFVTFEVRVKENVPLGSKIPNEATIIFDVNDPINTPSISTIIGSPSTKISLPFIRKK